MAKHPPPNLPENMTPDEALKAIARLLARQALKDYDEAVKLHAQLACHRVSEDTQRRKGRRNEKVDVARLLKRNKKLRIRESS